MTDSIPMNKLGDLVNLLSVTHHDDDFVDRLNYRTTSLVLLSTAIFIFSKDYIGNPMQCWGSAEWSKGWHEYAHDICYVENTYFVPLTDGKLSRDPNFKEEAKLGYYQWVPFILVFQAICFLIPHFFWQYFHWLFSEIQLRAILSMVNQARVSGQCISKEARKTIAFHLNKSLDKKRNEKTFGILPQFITQHSLSGIYCFTKILFFLNTIVQIWFLGIFIGNKNNFFGFFSSWSTLNGNQFWEQSGLFPRVTMCDFLVRSVTGGGHIEHNTVQCVLAGNMINEKVFIGLSLWLVILNALTAVNLIRWFYRLFFAQNRLQIIKELLPSYAAEILYPLTTEDEDNVRSILLNFSLNTAKIATLENLLDTLNNELEEENNEYSESTTTEVVCSNHCLENTMKIENNEQNLELEKHAKKQSYVKEHEQKVKKSVRQFINYMKLKEAINISKPEEISKFIGSEGVLVFELIRLNSHDLIASAILLQIINDRIKNDKKFSMKPNCRSLRRKALSRIVLRRKNWKPKFAERKQSNGQENLTCSMNSSDCDV